MFFAGFTSHAAFPGNSRRAAVGISVIAVIGACYLLRYPIAALVWGGLPSPLTAHLDIIDERLAWTIGTYYFNGGAYDLRRAEKAFRRVLWHNPNAPLAHFQLARIAFIQGRFGDALVEANLQIQNHPEIPNNLYLRGLIYGYRREYEKAADDFTAFIARVPSQWAGYNDLAWVEAMRGDYAAARAAIVSAFATIPGIDQQNPWLWSSLGVAELNLGSFAAALDALNTAERLARAMEPARFWMAYPGNHPANAESGHSEFLATIAMNKALTLEKLGMTEDARQAYRIFLEMAPPDAYPIERERVSERIRSL